MKFETCVWSYDQIVYISILPFVSVEQMLKVFYLLRMFLRTDAVAIAVSNRQMILYLAVVACVIDMGHGLSLFGYCDRFS